ncbi:MAG: TetR/AcrR family transcriptional regulator [Pseudomonadota bacterium]
MSQSPLPHPRERLIEAARLLFLHEGVPQTGINTVTAMAGVARMTLYNNFDSKEDLVVEVFKREACLRRSAIKDTQATLEGPFEKALALFVVAEELTTLDGFRGCAFINLAVEAAAPESSLHTLAKQHKEWIYENVLAHLVDGSFSSPADLAKQVCILWDGSIVNSYIHQSNAPISVARDAARSLMRAAVS